MKYNILRPCKLKVEKCCCLAAVPDEVLEKAELAAAAVGLCF